MLRVRAGAPPVRLAPDQVAVMTLQQWGAVRAAMGRAAAELLPQAIADPQGQAAEELSNMVRSDGRSCWWSPPD